ncbi:ATP-dependent DNA helicase Q-like 4A [Abeliophyllum distichum]|uniref:ATP-dependent DNA helicase Q-like 4A n=1 Tax=Abeliophyllum distichum TaxID=126358 RepID=A0ABD1P9F0_9LAMI
MKENHVRGRNLEDDFKCSNKLPKVNWLQHANAHNNFLSQDKFLSSIFLFSLPTQKPQIDETMNARSVVFRVQDVRMHNAQVEKAWQLLSSLQLSSKSYTKPGKSVPLTNNVSSFTFQDSRQTTQQCSSDLKRMSSVQMHQSFSGGDVQIGDSGRRLDTSFPPCNSEVEKVRKVMSRENASYSLASDNFYAQTRNGVTSNSSMCKSASNRSKASYTDGVDDDDILENIDVDQIVMDHFQSTSTPQPSTSKLPWVTPNANKDTFSDHDETNLPPELCLNCTHNCKLGLCPKASNHLQDMKDKLIAISNDLIDNADNLSSDELEKLRQERQQLNKQIQHLEKYLHSTSVNEERKMSHFSASTATPMTFQYETPPTVPFRIDPTRLDDKFQVNTEPDSFDKKWSGRDFPWTKKLEANNKKVFGNHSFRPNQREVINATMSGYDVFVLMPTGGGKSLTYQLPALICPGITLVISPLVSLIQDQIMHLLQANIPAAYLSANMEWTEQQEIFRELSSEYCKYKLLYVTPEKVAK